MLTRVLWARVERAKSGESEEKSICVGRSVVSCECVGEEKGSSSGRELRGTDMLLLLLSLLTAITSSNDLVSACNMLACHRRPPADAKAESYSYRGPSRHRVAFLRAGRCIWRCDARTAASSTMRQNKNCSRRKSTINLRMS